MRTLKIIANAFIVLIVLPVTIVAVLGFLFAPFQPTARASEPHIVLEANDIML